MIRDIVCQPSISRDDVYEIAIRSKKRLEQNNTEPFREMIALCAHDLRIDIWLDVFSDNPEMCELFKRDDNNENRTY